MDNTSQTPQNGRERAVQTPEMNLAELLIVQGQIIRDIQRDGRWFYRVHLIIDRHKTIYTGAFIDDKNTMIELWMGTELVKVIKVIDHEC